MGYMGLGLQKWIYTQRSRSPFSTVRKPCGSTQSIDKGFGSFAQRFEGKLSSGDPLKVAKRLLSRKQKDKCKNLTAEFS